MVHCGHAFIGHFCSRGFSTSVVETVTSNRVFTANDVLAAYQDHWLASNALTFESGDNAGRTLEIKGWVRATF